MMNYIWAAMLLLGIAFAALNKNMGSFTEGLMESYTNGVSFAIGLAGIMAVWSGMMKIASETGLIRWMAKGARPLMGFLFPRERNPDTIAAMLMSFVANLFGAGNSSTVFALSAMARLDEENGRKPEASATMCMFIAVNMSMIQLVPVTLMKIRSDAGAANPTDVIVPSIIAGCASMVVSIAVCKFYERKEAR